MTNAPPDQDNAPLDAQLDEAVDDHHRAEPLFHQDTPGDWNGVMEQVCAALGQWSGSSRN